jgi:hypothetical protein
MSQNLVTSPGRSDGVSAAGNVFRLRNDNFHFFRKCMISSSICRPSSGGYQHRCSANMVLVCVLNGTICVSFPCDNLNGQFEAFQPSRRPRIAPASVALSVDQGIQVCVARLRDGRRGVSVRRAASGLDWSRETVFSRDQVFPAGTGAANAGIGSRV